MRLTAEPAFVLHTRPWRETSLLVEVLSREHGRMGLVARGVQGPKRHVLRAALQPLQWIRFDAVHRGELARLTGAEALDAAPRLGGDATLAAFYLNELTLRLAPRGDPVPELYEAYATARERLGAGEPLAWTLRRFERDLLDALGFGLDWGHEEGDALDPAARYRVDVEQGPQRIFSDRGQADRSQAATGRGLLALARDVQPPAEDLASLRRPMRSVLAHHLGPRGLRSWELLGEIAQVGRAGGRALPAVDRVGPSDLPGGMPLAATGVPEAPEAPERSDLADVSEAPGAAEAPKAPDAPEPSDLAEMPEAPESSASPAAPEALNGPEVPAARAAVGGRSHAAPDGDA